MIKGERRVKDLIKNVAKGDSGKAQRLQRHYAMERFLERMALSDYRDKMILKGGVLVSSIMGLDARSTMDIDATCKGFALDLQSATRILTYSVETLLSEKLETVLSRSVNNTRPRDFYDIFVLTELGYPQDGALFSRAFASTCSKRGTVIEASAARSTFELIRKSGPMEDRWLRFGRDFDYASGIGWPDALDAAADLFEVTV